MDVARRVQVSRRVEEKLLIDPLVALDSPANDRGHRRLAWTRFRVGEVDPSVPGVLRMDLDVEQPAVLTHPGGGRSTDRVPLELVLLDDAQPARALGDEQTSIRQKRQ